LLPKRRQTREGNRYPELIRERPRDVCPQPLPLALTLLCPSRSLFRDHLSTLYESFAPPGPSEWSKEQEIQYLARKLAQSTGPVSLLLPSLPPHAPFLPAPGGYVAADISTLLKEGAQRAASLPLEDISSMASQPPSVPLSERGACLLLCLLEARSSVPPSCLRGDLVKVPQVCWTALFSLLLSLLWYRALL
jgi:hypothetical protein